MRMLLSLAFLLASAHQATSETSISLFGSGAAMSGSVSLSDPGGAGNLSFPGGWDMQGNAGMRVTWWTGERYGVGLELNATSANASQATLAANGLNELALDDGINLISINAFRRWAEIPGGLRPYLGAGLGLSVPNVAFDGGGAVTENRQVTGPAVQVMAGASMPVSDRLSVFGEYQGAYAVNMAELAGNGSLQTNLLLNGINFGVSLGF